MIIASVTGKSNVSEVLPTGQLSNIPWRRAGVKYTNNEAYFDVIEEVRIRAKFLGLMSFMSLFPPRWTLSLTSPEAQFPRRSTDTLTVQWSSLACLISPWALSTQGSLMMSPSTPACGNFTFAYTLSSKWLNRLVPGTRNGRVIEFSHLSLLTATSGWSLITLAVEVWWVKSLKKNVNMFQWMCRWQSQSMWDIPSPGWGAPREDLTSLLDQNRPWVGPLKRYPFMLSQIRIQFAYSQQPGEDWDRDAQVCAELQLDTHPGKI